MKKRLHFWREIEKNRR